MKLANRLLLDAVTRFAKSLLVTILLHQLYDQVLTADIVIQNRGKVAMGFTVFGASHGSDCTPGQIVVSPVTVSERLLLSSVCYSPIYRDTSQPWSSRC